MPFSEDKFRDHIKQVVKSQSFETDRPLTLDELKELAESMGVSEREWGELMIKAEQTLNAALGHLKVENYTDAIEMAEEATSINPYIKDGNAILAQCYYKLGLVDKNDELLTKAGHYARMELKNDPLDSIALNVLSAVETIQKEGKFSKKTIRTVAYVVGALLLVFVILFMCTRTVNPDDPGVINSGSPDQEMTRLTRNVNSTKAAYISAIERRNDIALELVGQVDDRSDRKELKESITEYDFEDIRQSEQRFRLALSDVKANLDIGQEMSVRLQGGENRINSEKRRYQAAVADYNSTLESSDVEGDFEPIEPLE
jgi:tetratricopeptide (TPR) repeat protein